MKEHFQHLTTNDTVFIHNDLPLVDTKAQKIFLDFKEASIYSRKKETWVMMALASVLEETRIYPLAALKDAIAMKSSICGAKPGGSRGGQRD